MKNEHYVPQAYLRLFAPENDDRISRYSLVEKHGGGDYYHPKDYYPIQKAASATGFADELFENPQTTDAEEDMRNALKSLDSGDSLSESELIWISEFLLFQRDRTPRSKMFHQTMGTLNEALGGQNYDWEDVVHHDSKHAFENLMMMGWRVIENHTELPFFTSDFPVVWWRDVHPDRDPNTMDFFERVEIYCPIGPNHLLMLLDPATFDIEPLHGDGDIPRIEVSERTEIWKFNLLQGLTSFREVFAPVEYGDLLRVMIEKMCDAFPNKEYVRGPHAEMDEIEKAREIAVKVPTPSEQRWYREKGKEIILDQQKSANAMWGFNHCIDTVEELRFDTPKRGYWEQYRR